MYPFFSPFVFSLYLCILPTILPLLIPPLLALTPPLSFPQGHSSFITHLDWAKDSSCFVTNSGDYEILYCEFSEAQRHSFLLQPLYLRGVACKAFPELWEGREALASSSPSPLTAVVSGCPEGWVSWLLISSLVDPTFHQVLPCLVE